MGVDGKIHAICVEEIDIVQEKICFGHDSTF
jgi:hypothetical protein